MRIKHAGNPTGYAYISHMFQKAIEWDKAVDNPVKNIRQLRVDNRRLRYLSLEEIRRLLKISDLVLHPVLVTALHTGLRRGELFSLMWQDVNLKVCVIHVLHTKNGDRRDIPISPTLNETLRRFPRRLDSDYVFPGKTGK